MSQHALRSLPHAWRHDDTDTHSPVASSSQISKNTIRSYLQWHGPAWGRAIAFSLVAGTVRANTTGRVIHEGAADWQQAGGSQQQPLPTTGKREGGREESAAGRPTPLVYATLKPHLKSKCHQIHLEWHVCKDRPPLKDVWSKKTKPTKKHRISTCMKTRSTRCSTCANERCENLPLTWGWAIGNFHFTISFFHIRR